MIRLKVPLKNRKKAVRLLCRGASIEEVVQAMASKHPGVPLDVIRQKYFPKSGAFAIQYLQGLPRAVFQEKLRSFDSISARSSRTMKRTMSKPESKARARTHIMQIAATSKHAERTRQAMTAPHQDPVFARRAVRRGRRTLKRLWKTKKFRRKIVKVHRALGKELAKDQAWRKRMADGRVRFNTAPEYEQERANRERKISRARKKFLRKHPEIVEAMRQRFIEARGRPDFHEKMLEGIRKSTRHLAASIDNIRKYNDQLRRQREAHVVELQEQGVIGAWIGEKGVRGKSVSVRVAATTRTAAQEAMLHERHRLIRQSFHKLTAIEQEAVYLAFGLRGREQVTSLEASEIMKITNETYLSILQGALQKLRGDKILRELVEAR